MNTQIQTMSKPWQNEWVYMAFLLLFILIMPAQWERLEFMCMMLIPIVLSRKYFTYTKEEMIRACKLLALFIVANYSTFILHVWQLKWEIHNQDGLFGWKWEIDPLLYSIPFNDGMWLRQFAHPLLDQFFVTIYIHGFITCLLALAIYFMLTSQHHKIVHAIFAGHFLQYLLILPFHFWVDGHQVWWIQNQWEGTNFIDPIKGYRTYIEPIIPSLNHVFPSMHTSIATVAILIALREASKPVKYFFVSLNVAIIISTVYLGIHWVVDVFGGVIFGYLCFKLADKIMQTKMIKEWSLLKKKEVYDPSYQSYSKQG